MRRACPAGHYHQSRNLYRFPAYLLSPNPPSTVLVYSHLSLTPRPSEIGSKLHHRSTQSCGNQYTQKGETHLQGQAYSAQPPKMSTPKKILYSRRVPLMYSRRVPLMDSSPSPARSARIFWGISWSKPGSGLDLPRLEGFNFIGRINVQNTIDCRRPYAPL